MPSHVHSAFSSALCGTLILWLPAWPAHAADSREPGARTPATDLPASDLCRIGDWDMQVEQRLFGAAPRRIGAARHLSEQRPELAPGTLWAMTLVQEADVHLAAAVRRRRASGPSFAGLASVAVPVTGRYRITVDGPAWIEIVRDGQPLPTTKFGSQRACPLFRKSVEFELAAGLPHVLQLSNAASAELRVTIEPSADPVKVRTPSQPD